MKNLRLLLSLLCIFTIQLSFANHDEAVDGDLSNDPMNPTILQIGGDFTVCASSIQTNGVIDGDFYTFTVPPGATLDEIVLSNFSSANVGFIGFSSGTTIDPSGAPASLLGLSLLGSVTGPILQVLNDDGVAGGTMGFTIPLGPGDYTFWTQETSSTVPTSYCLDFQITTAPVAAAIPTMGEWGLMILVLLMLIFGTIQITSMKSKQLLPQRV